MAIDRSLAARTYEIIHISTAAGKTLTGREALKKAVEERCGGDIEVALELLTSAMDSIGKQARAATHNLPEQPTLFDLPSTIGISTPLGDLFVAAEDATAGQVTQWAREGRQHHGSQHRRFKAMCEHLEALALDPSENYKTQVKALNAGRVK